MGRQDHLDGLFCIPKKGDPELPYHLSQLVRHMNACLDVLEVGHNGEGHDHQQRP